MDTEDITSERKAALARMEKALKSSVGMSSKRPPMPTRSPSAKKPRIASDSEDDSDSDDSDEAEPCPKPQQAAATVSGAISKGAMQPTLQEAGV